MASSYLDYLPPALRESPEAGEILAAIEAVFTHPYPANNATESLEVLVDSIGRWFRPIGVADQRIPDERSDFLPWLARLLSVSLRADWDNDTRRRVLAEAVPLYRQRGTKAGLQRLLLLHLSTGELAEPMAETGLFAYRPDAAVRILDTTEEFGFEAPPNYFAVDIDLTHTAPARLRRDQNVAIAVIEAEKPAHTVYGLRLSFPTLKLGTWILGSDNSVLGTRVLGEN